MKHIIPTAEPFFFPGNSTGCLLVHGFTGTPKEMRWLGEFLAEQGYSVLAVRLAGHATRPEDMIRSHYQDWLASIEDGWNLLSGVSQQIFLIGLSMGGVLSLLSSTRLPAAGVVAMSTPYRLQRDWRLNFIRQIAWFMPYLRKSSHPDGGWFDHEALKEHVSYPKNPVRSIAELNELLADMRASLPAVDVPVLLVHSRDDPYVAPESMPQIFDQLGTKDKEMVWIDKSGHVIPREPQREAVFRRIAEFIQRVEASLAEDQTLHTQTENIS